jgi:hypothetical protein
MEAVTFLSTVCSSSSLSTFGQGVGWILVGLSVAICHARCIDKVYLPWLSRLVCGMYPSLIKRRQCCISAYSFFREHNDHVLVEMGSV